MVGSLRPCKSSSPCKLVSWSGFNILHHRSSLGSLPLFHRMTMGEDKGKLSFSLSLHAAEACLWIFHKDDKGEEETSDRVKWDHTSLSILEMYTVIEERILRDTTERTWLSNRRLTSITAYFVLARLNLHISKHCDLTIDNYIYKRKSYLHIIELQLLCLVV